MQFLMHYDHMNIMIIYKKDLTLSLCFYSVYVISYFDVFFCHYDCLLLKIQPSFPDLV